MSYTICSRFKGVHIVYAGYTICTSREHIVYGAFCGSTVLYSHEDGSINIICRNVLEDIIQFYLLMWKKNRLETPFKCDNVKALIKTSNCENLVLYFSEKVLVFSDQTIAWKWFRLPQ